MGRPDDQEEARDRLRSLLVDEVFTDGVGDGTPLLGRYELFDRLSRCDRLSAGRRVCRDGDR
ncbi:hypothetical protein [Streptomyces sp. CC228A]|uniref:hypothetical protein n=1 Tax=Streptomyces sp. CC228A TaxID=2898186 RepID=UPI001F261D5F|nr:hypothetical protein [Streptomyces sp. CC228A]